MWCTAGNMGPMGGMGGGGAGRLNDGGSPRPP